MKKSFEKEGWRIKDVQRDCCGYDLLCTKGAWKRRDVEVKGVAGSLACCIVTVDEAHQASVNPNFCIHFVTEALSTSPNILKLTGPRFLSKFELKPIQYTARLKRKRTHIITRRPSSKRASSQ